MQVAVISEQNRNSLKVTNNMACPNCGSTYGINDVVSYRSANEGGGAVVNRKYCKHCSLEFDTKGRLFPPLYY